MSNGETVASLEVTLGSIVEIDTSTNVTADVYSNNKTYSIGDYAIHAKYLYKCNTEISEPEDFDENKWDKVKLADEIKNLEEELGTKADSDEVYTKQQVDDALVDKANVTDLPDMSNYYTKNEVDADLALKANTSEVNSALALKADFDKVFEINLAKGTTITSGKAVKFSNGTLSNSSIYSATDYIDISGSTQIIYSKPFTTSTSLPQTGMAFYDENKVYISGHIIGYYAGYRHYELTQIIVPNNAKYARFTVDTSLSDAFITYDVTQYNAALKTQSEKSVDNLEQDVFVKNYADGMSYTEGRAIKYSDGTVITSTAFCASEFIDVSNITTMLYSKICATVSTVPQTGMAFYDGDENYILGQRIDYNSPYPRYELTQIAVPSNAKYARFTINLIIEEPFVIYDLDQYNGALETKINKSDDKLINYARALGLHTTPESIGVLNLIKRCRQMTDIEWTPAVDLPRFMRENTTPPYDANYDISDSMRYIGKFEAGKKYKGIPYGRCTNYIPEYGYSNTYVGLTIPFDTFITAIQNAESIISKASVGDLENHRSIAYAAVCSVLTCYALNVSYYATANIPDIPGLNTLSHLKVDDEYIDPKLFKLGDILNLQSDHTVVITDLVYDDAGEVLFIEISEAAAIGSANRSQEGGECGGLCRRVGYSVTDFFDRFGDYDLLRYEYIGSIPYTPSKYVNVGDELNMARLLDLPVIPYMGEGFKYKAGYLPNTTLVITSTYYNKLRVFKDGTEIAGSPFTVPANTTSVDVGFSEAGNYEAYLCNMSGGSNTRISAKCHWSVI